MNFNFFAKLFGQNQQNTAHTLRREGELNPQQALRRALDEMPKGTPARKGVPQSKEEFLADLRTGNIEGLQTRKPKGNSTFVYLPAGAGTVKIGPDFANSAEHFKAYAHMAKLVGRAIYRMERGLALVSQGYEKWAGNQVWVYTLADPVSGKLYKTMYGQFVNDNGNPYTGWLTLHQVESADERTGEIGLKWGVHYSEKYTRQAAWHHNEKAGEWKAPIWGAPTLFVFAALLLAGKEVTLKTSYSGDRYTGIIQAESIRISQ
jgi:hypothetical protein